MCMLSRMDKAIIAVCAAAAYAATCTWQQQKVLSTATSIELDLCLFMGCSVLTGADRQCAMSDAPGCQLGTR